jgi:uncharacterized membrane protein
VKLSRVLNILECKSKYSNNMLIKTNFRLLIIFFHQNLFFPQKEADLIIEHEKHSNTQSLLMKHAIANSVRLCVVAPTVHVHIADEEHKLQSG